MNTVAPVNTAQWDVAADPGVRLPRPPGAIRRWMSAHPRTVDAIIVIGYLLGAGLGVFLDILELYAGGVAPASSGFAVPAYLAGPWWIIAVLRVVVVATALWYRRSFPFAGLAIVNIAMIGEHGIQGLATSVALLFLLYAVPVYKSVSAGWLGYGISVVAAVVADLLASVDAPLGEFTGSDRTLPAVLMFGAVAAAWYLAVVLLGMNLGNRRRYLQAIIDRAHQLARERDQLARLAVAEERTRIAREMHDIVAHSLSVMIALSEGAGRVVTQAPAEAAIAMERSAETGRKALVEMRRLLGALRDPLEADTEPAPQPSLADLPDLIQSFRNAGLEIHDTVAGVSAGDRSHELAVYRVVQEGLTNALRYAGTGTQVMVRVEHLANVTHITVQDTGARGASTPLTGALGAGRGLAGLKERARMFGGDVSARPLAAPEHGWQLTATLPATLNDRAGTEGRAHTEGEK